LGRVKFLLARLEVVGLGVHVGVGVLVGFGVKVGVLVGPNNFPGPQALSNIDNARATRIIRLIATLPSIVDHVRYNINKDD